MNTNPNAQNPAAPVQTTQNTSNALKTPEIGAQTAKTGYRVQITAENAGESESEASE